MAAQADDLALAGFAESQADQSRLEQKAYQEKGSLDDADYSVDEAQIHPDSPTEEEKASLRRVPDAIDYR